MRAPYPYILVHKLTDHIVMLLTDQISTLTVWVWLTVNKCFANRWRPTVRTRSRCFCFMLPDMWEHRDEHDGSSSCSEKRHDKWWISSFDHNCNAITVGCSETDKQRVFQLLKHEDLSRKCWMWQAKSFHGWWFWLWRLGIWFCRIYIRVRDIVSIKLRYNCIRKS